jgi:hypothetical protein
MSACDPKRTMVDLDQILSGHFVSNESRRMTQAWPCPSSRHGFANAGAFHRKYKPWSETLCVASNRKGYPMHPAIMAIAVGTQLLTPVSDVVPKLDVESTCKKSVEADKEMALNLAQSFDKCMSDENSARQQLGPVWSSYSVAVRTECEKEATLLGEASYVDLLTCLQMTDGSTTTSASALKGASRKKRTPN